MSKEQPVPGMIRSPEMELRNEQGLRFERGGSVYATDGRVGVLRQVVVDEHVGEVTALVVDVDKSELTVLVPPQAVAKTGGAAVYLSGSRQQFAAWMEHAPRVVENQVAKANLKTLLRERHGTAHDPIRSVARAGRDFIETGSPSIRRPAPQLVAAPAAPAKRIGDDTDRRPFSIIGAGRK